MPENYIVWVKRLGQRHYAKAGFDSETLCGLPMLGNNYVNIIPFDEQDECVECRGIRDGGKLHFTLDKNAKGVDKRMLEALGYELERCGWVRDSDIGR